MIYENNLNQTNSYEYQVTRFYYITGYYLLNSLFCVMCNFRFYNVDYFVKEAKLIACLPSLYYFSCCIPI